MRTVTPTQPPGGRGNPAPPLPAYPYRFAGIPGRERAGEQSVEGPPPPLLLPRHQHTSSRQGPTYCLPQKSHLPGARWSRSSCCSTSYHTPLTRGGTCSQDDLTCGGAHSPEDPTCRGTNSHRNLTYGGAGTVPNLRRYLQSIRPHLRRYLQQLYLTCGGTRSHEDLTCGGAGSHEQLTCGGN